MVEVQFLFYTTLFKNCQRPLRSCEHPSFEIGSYPGKPNWVISRKTDRLERKNRPKSSPGGHFPKKNSLSQPHMHSESDLHTRDPGQMGELKNARAHTHTNTIIRAYLTGQLHPGKGPPRHGNNKLEGQRERREKEREGEREREREKVGWWWGETG